MTFINWILGVSLLLAAGLIALVARPLLRDEVPMNHVYGVRIKKAFESEENWYAINRFGARCVLAWAASVALVGVLCLFLPFGERPVPILLAGLSPALLVIPVLVRIHRYARRL